MSDKIGIYVCECGPNIGSKVDIQKIMDTISNLEDYKDKELIVKNHKLLCSVAGKKFLEEEIKENKLTHLICAACSPRDHDTTFINICKKTHLNPYMYRIVNIREHCAWIFPDKDVATEKAIRYIHAGMDRVLYQNPLIEKHLDSIPDVLVIGAGISGIETALTLANEKRKVFLVEKTNELGGHSLKLKELLPMQGISLNSLRQKIADIKENKQIKVFTNTEVESIVGFLGNFEVSLRNKKENNIIELMTGAVILANGYDLFDANELPDYDFSEEDNVFTALEIEEMYFQKGKITLRSGEIPKSVALIHCIGRDNVGYCSKICCNYLLKIARYLSEQSSNTKIIDLYRDMCLPNKKDQKFYEFILERDVQFIKTTNVSLSGTKIQYTGLDHKRSDLKADMVILAPAMIPTKDNVKLAELLKIDQDEFGFYKESHSKLNPISANLDGIFFVGASRAPTSISEAIIQAQAASGKILTQLIPGQKIIPEVMVSEILEAYCTGCKTCLDVCGFGSIYFDEDKGISIVNEAICRGCGNCVGSCPSGSIRTKHFTNPQLYQEVKEALR